VSAFHTPLPIDAVLDELRAALATHTSVVLVAPPGAGKTTRVPLALLDADWVAGRSILVLEPRRIAARASAARMAATLRENVGATVGYRVRLGSRVSRATRIEVVTEGIFTRRILDDPELTGVAAVLFDEFHERSLEGDLGLALARDVQQALREDLRILVMSATLDDTRISTLLGDAPVVESQGRGFAVETSYLGRKADQTIERQMADAIGSALHGNPGSVLAFLPGAAEIRRVQNLLLERVSDATVDIVPLFGALDAGTQDRAIAPAPPGRRKVVLATSIAETSLTIEGVRIVVDSGLSRLPRYEPDIGLTRLVTLRASRAAVDQRRGRAGRTAPGICYRLWDEPQTTSLAPFTPPEILSADLSSLVLDLAQWGVRDPATMAFLDVPPPAAWQAAVILLRELNALDPDGRITAEGKSLRALALPPRLARMIIAAHHHGAGKTATLIAALLTERGLGGDAVDLEHQLERLQRDRSARATTARDLAQRWAAQVAGTGRRHSGDAGIPLAVMLSFAFPDRVARNRGDGTFLLANGRGAMIDQSQALARAPYLVIAEMTGSAAQSRIVLAAAISLEEIESHFAREITTADEISFDRNAMALRGRRRRLLHALPLSQVPLALAPSGATAAILAAGLTEAGLDKLPWSSQARQWRQRVSFLHRSEGGTWPDMSDDALIESQSEWLLPLLHDKLALRDIGAAELSQALLALLPWPLRPRLDQEAPSHFQAPTGSMIAIDYDAAPGPTVAVRLQELFGLTRHPTIAGGRVPLVLELLSPAQRPVQVTRDLPGFWRGSYSAVRADLRGRYPRHPWPEDPASAPPTRRAKPRGT